MLGHRLRHVVGPDALENEGCRLAVAKHELAGDAAVRARQRGLRVEREVEARRAEDGAVLGDLRLVLVPPVVEARLDLEPEPDRAANLDDSTYEPVPVRLARGGDRHEVLDLCDAVGGEEARDQDVRVREVELLDGAVLVRRADAEVAAALPVENCAEDARRVEAGAAVPVDRAVRPDERDGVKVSDHAVLGDRQVVERGVHGGHRCRSGGGRSHGYRDSRPGIIIRYVAVV